MARNAQSARVLACDSLALEIQVIFTAAHNVDKRLARWLLMCHDRTEG